MSGWQALIWGVTCAMGVLVFLTEVADEVGRVEESTACLEEAERKAYRKRHAASEDEEIITLTAA